LKDNGILFLKCFSEKEPKRGTGPHRFSIDTIEAWFVNNGFKIHDLKEYAYQGTLNPLPKTLFVVMAKTAYLSNCKIKFSRNNFNWFL
jgi:hypothetical protein